MQLMIIKEEDHLDVISRYLEPRAGMLPLEAPSEHIVGQEPGECPQVLADYLANIDSELDLIKIQVRPL